MAYTQIYVVYKYVICIRTHHIYMRVYTHVMYTYMSSTHIHTYMSGRLMGNTG